ncbi:heavy metal-binding protein [Acidithiobacillus ferrooxidans]|uniref:CopZ family metallochaperone n=1 Tax=Acidithiobacillus ferrooxidans TaxID=920 RepID=UPI001C06B73F|nr:cation transporter [Acidithiobacillus ferrooxidans]MBU2772721.1 heavy metal-binding protein [Acidithiobacillus ferrooxidans]
MSDIRLKITGMTCGHCVRAVTKALEGIPGVEKADVTLEPGEAVVHGLADTTTLIAVIREEGYEAEECKKSQSGS